MKRAHFIVGVAVAAAVLAVMPFLDRYVAYLVTIVAISSIGALGLNLLTGLCGQISFAQAGLMGIGAYTAGNLCNAGLGLLAIPLGGLAAATASIVIGLPALRLRGLYFAIATLAAQFILEYLFKILEPLTHGISGLLIRPPTVFGFAIQDDRANAALAVALLVLVWSGIGALRATNLGRAFLVVRENEIVARGMGIDVARTKFWAFLLSGFIAGIAGAMSGIASRLANPEAFSFALSVDYVAMIIVGGQGTLTGPLLGAAFVTLLPEVIQRVGELFNMPSILSALREFAFGMLIILFLIFEPLGLMAVLRKLRLRLGASKPGGKSPAATTEAV
ncbi:branched-chain amino acid ABC transporter permease [Azospirillum sp. A1-3]|uniref:branched-chain amino acid ABC transporter permease n=1 Tax=Azospirillum sp. A1-3 TaxID=185874 RepID=UPI0020775AC8|nr:branched-chain amino acid ABC transporter permease [Azospirillum sp. A1-3]MCM8735616.1 branched-chain amino acid ABC transporter permease [Azospirillum sp. A1-3]